MIFLLCLLTLVTGKYSLKTLLNKKESLSIKRVKEYFLLIFFESNCFQVRSDRFIIDNYLSDFSITLFKNPVFGFIRIFDNVLYYFVDSLNDFYQLWSHPWILLQQLILKTLSQKHDLRLIQLWFLCFLWYYLTLWRFDGLINDAWSFGRLALFA